MGNSLLAKTQETFLYDADGNLTNDGRWIYTWDAENRDPLGDEAFRLSLPRDFDLPLEEGSLYAFVQNNPVSRTDLLGLFSKFKDCDCCQVEALKKDEAVAQAHIEGLKKSIQAVLPAILADPQKYPYRTAFKFNTALTKLDKASKKLKSATVKCEKSSGPIASAFPWGNTVKVYEAYWYYTDFGQGAHLVHEGTHMGSGTTDATYFWQNQRAPHDTFFIPWNEIASTYDSWIINGFCIPGYDCPKGTLPPATHIRRSSKECP